MSSARRRYVTLLFGMAGAGLAIPALAADPPVPMSGVIAGVATTAPSPDSTSAPHSTTGMHSTSTYVPPNAAQLIQLLAPIAVFPDSLVAEVLAAATYPDQVVAVDAWLAQNGKLTGAPLQSALAQQGWDDGVKGLALFPEVLHQMATNPQWTAALGEAYINDPVDVMNAVQALRQKAIANGNLKSSKYLTVTSAPNDMATLPADASPDPDEPPVYDGPAVVPPPEQIVEIAPADPGDVYVPYYDPGVFYGSQFGVWPGYAYAWPAPLYYGSAFAFGAAIAIDFGFGHPWGWHSWHTRWGPGYYGHGWRGPGVVHDNHPYANHSDRIVNHFAPHESGGYRRADPPARSIEPVANAPGRTGIAANGGGIDPSPARGVGLPANRVDPTHYGQMPMPHFDGAMAQRGNAVAAHADAATAGHSTHEAALASTRYAPQRNTAGTRDTGTSGNTYGRDAGEARRSSPPSYRSDRGYARGTPMESRVIAQRPRPPQQNLAPRSVRGGDVQGRDNQQAGGREAPSRGAPSGGNGGRASAPGHR